MIVSKVWMILLCGLVISAPINHHSHSSHRQLEKSLEIFLGEYYDKYISEPTSTTINIYDMMQGDQPQNQPNDGDDNNTELEYFRTMRNRTKDHWIQILKENILRQMGRSNTSITSPSPLSLQESKLGSINISSILPILLNASNRQPVSSSLIDLDDQITEKIRSHYPSCDVPTNNDQNIWNDDENTMYLYFDFDRNPNEKMNIATAILRLYRINDNSSRILDKPQDCNNSSSSANDSDEEKLLRVSVNWYSRTLKRKRVKRRLADSKVISDGVQWVELNVKPATRAWSKGKNLGLVIVVEDQEGNILKADRYFKGVDCMVGSSTPKPIPTIIIDAALQTNELNRIAGLIGGNTTSNVHHNLPMLPSIDICTLEFPDNYNQPLNISTLRINACNLKKLYEHNQFVADKEQLERLATLPDLLASSKTVETQSLATSRHIRHQRQHYLAQQQNLANQGIDPRSSIINQRVLTPDEVRSLNLNFTTRNR